jgi:conjugal transfer/entry exclusion protein
MPLNYQNQMQLLQDILRNHQEDCCGSVSECEQVERLVTSLMVNSDIHENIKPILQEIYQYSHTGISSSNLNTHITSHQQNLSQWVDGMNTYS